MAKARDYFGMVKRRCRCCGKSFYIHLATPYGYVIKNGNRTWYFCSYRCMRAVEVPLIRKAEARMRDEFSHCRSAEYAMEVQ